MAMPSGWKPAKSALGEEKILWKHDIKKGVFRRRIVGTLAVTNHRVIGVDTEIPLREVDDIVVMNRRQVTTHSGTSRHYPGGASSGWENIKLESETRVTGDIAFMRNGEPAIVFRGFSNPDYLVSLARSARENVLEILNSVRSDAKEPQNDAAIACSQCGTSNPPSSRFCNSCGRSLAPACPKCGKENPGGASFCGHCGTPL